MAGMPGLFLPLMVVRNKASKEEFRDRACLPDPEMIITDENMKERAGDGMGLFIGGILTGILMCVVIMLVRCAAWFERMHPEDDYWHLGTGRRTAQAEPEEQRETEEQ